MKKSRHNLPRRDGLFSDGLAEAWREKARDLKRDLGRLRGDYWFKTFPKGYFMYNPVSGVAYIYRNSGDYAYDSSRLSDGRLLDP